MGDSFVSLSLRPLGYQSPLLLVALVGMILGVVTLKRHGAAAVLCLVGCGAFLLTAVAAAGVSASLIQQLRDQKLTTQQYGEASNLVTVIGSVGRAVGFGLVVAAAFAGRRPAPTGRAFDVLPPPPPAGAAARFPMPPPPSSFRQPPG